MIRTNANAYNVFVITPGGALPRPASGGIYVTEEGNVTMKVGGVQITLTAVPANTHIPMVVDSVSAATATVLGLY